MAQIEIPNEIITIANNLNIDAVGRVAFDDDMEIPDEYFQHGLLYMDSDGELSATDLCMACLKLPV